MDKNNELFEIETLQNWQVQAGAEDVIVVGGGSNNCSNDQAN